MTITSYNHMSHPGLEVSYMTTYDMHSSGANNIRLMERVELNI